MEFRKIIFYWLLLLVPTLLIGGLALLLVSREAERYEQVSIEAAKDNAQLAVDGIRLAVTSMKEGLIDQLADMDPDEDAEALWDLERSNPLVRNVFITDGQGQILLPSEPERQSAEKAEFVARYDSLFQGRVAWYQEQQEQVDAQVPVQVASSKSWSKFSRRSQALDEIRNISKKQYYGKFKGPQTANAAPDQQDGALPVLPDRDGWIPWYAENQFYLLGFYFNGIRQLYFGVEIETIALLSRLRDALPEEYDSGEVYVLRNKDGMVIHQRGSGKVAPGEEPLLALNIGPVLPHYELAVFMSDPGRNGVARSGFFLVGGLLVGTFVIAIITGGSLLIVQAHRNIRDAAQKTNFVSNVSHELKTPLTTIRMYAELLGEDRVRDDKKKNKYMRVIIDESQRLTRLVNNVLDFGRLEQGRKKYNLEEINLVDFLQDLETTQQLHMRQHGMTLTCKRPDAHLNVWADRDALEQVLLNLIDNACKYARDGEVCHIDCTAVDGRVQLAVSDRGPGIPRDQQQRIFDKFHRVDDSLTSDQSGSGLGLTIARRLVEGMHGTVEYKTAPEGGAVFTVNLPGNGNQEYAPS